MKEEKIDTRVSDSMIKTGRRLCIVAGILYFTALYFQGSAFIFSVKGIVLIMAVLFIIAMAIFLVVYWAEIYEKEATEEIRKTMVLRIQECVECNSNVSRRRPWEKRPEIKPILPPEPKGYRFWRKYILRIPPIFKG